MLASKIVTTSSGDFTIAPLTLRQVETLYPGETFPTTGTVVYTALRNAGYEGDEDGLKDLLSPRSIGELFRAVLDLTGLFPAEPGEVAAPGTMSTGA